MIGSGTRTSSGCSRRVLRARSMFSATRATTVVSQPRRFSTSLVSARLSRSQASWTASSASLSEPEHPVGDRPQMRSVILELPGEPFLLIHVTFLPRSVSWK